MTHLNTVRCTPTQQSTDETRSAAWRDGPATGSAMLAPQRLPPGMAAVVLSPFPLATLFVPAAPHRDAIMALLDGSSGYLLRTSRLCGGNSQFCYATGLRDGRFVGIKALHVRSPRDLLAAAQEFDLQRRSNGARTLATPLFDPRGERLYSPMVLYSDAVPRIARGCRSTLPDFARWVCLEGLRALGDCHAAGVVHRDVKAANFLLECENTPGVHLKLADFGAARLLTQVEDDHFVGSSYVAPEEVLGGVGKTPVDMWGLGVMALSVAADSPFDDAPFVEPLRWLCPQGKIVDPQAARHWVASWQTFRSTVLPTSTRWLGIAQLEQQPDDPWRRALRGLACRDPGLCDFVVRHWLAVAPQDRLSVPDSLAALQCQVAPPFDAQKVFHSRLQLHLHHHKIVAPERAATLQALDRARRAMLAPAPL